MIWVPMLYKFAQVKYKKREGTRIMFMDISMCFKHRARKSNYIFPILIMACKVIKYEWMVLLLKRYIYREFYV